MSNPKEDWKKYSATRYACFRKNWHRRKDGSTWSSIDMEDISHFEDITYYYEKGLDIYKLVRVDKEDLIDIARLTKEWLEEEELEWENEKLKLDIEDKR